MKGRTTWYESVSEMQEDLDAYIETYNRNRPHRGRGMEGQTPYQVFKKKIRKPSVVSLKWRSHGLLSPGCPRRRPSTCTAPGPGSGRRCRP